MKTFGILLLLVAVGLLAFDDLGQRNSARDARNDITDAQDHANQQGEQIDALNAEIARLRGEKTGQPPGQTATLPQSATLAAYSDALVIIEGNNAVGSGFLCNMDGRTYIITNAHVLSNNPGLKFTSIKGTVFNVGAGAVAVEHDVVRLEVTGVQKAFDVMADASGNAKIDDMVTIPGNAEGAGVATQVDGKIVGFGPDLIEVDAHFVKGNSGSPIIHQLTGKVLGVATYTVKNKVNQAGRGTVQSEIRYFGYRLDDIKQWQPLNWQSFYAQSVQVEGMYTLSEDFIKLFGNANNVLDLDASNYASPEMQRSIRRFTDSIREGSRAMSIADRKNLIENFIADLRSVSHADIIAFNKNTAYDYFRREVEDQDRFREEIYQSLTKSLENIR